MTVVNMTTEKPDSAMTTGFWSAGDYDRLASYGSPAEAARLLRFAGEQRGDRVLDVGTGSGIVAVATARKGARVTGIDPTSELLVKARENATLADGPSGSNAQRRFDASRRVAARA